MDERLADAMWRARLTAWLLSACREAQSESVTFGPCRLESGDELVPLTRTPYLDLLSRFSFRIVPEHAFNGWRQFPGA
jgi:hypothetical protein